MGSMTFRAGGKLRFNDVLAARWDNKKRTLAGVIGILKLVVGFDLAFVAANAGRALCPTAIL
jgi:hypothetical protein